MNIKRLPIVVACMVGACTGEDDIQRPLPPLPCFAAESLALRPLIFGEIAHSEESGDYSGVEVRFSLDGASQLMAHVRVARGGLPAPRSVDSVWYKPSVDSVVFWYNSGSTTHYGQEYRPSCDRLVGQARLFVTAESPAGTLRADTMNRVLRPLPDNP